MVGVMLSDEEKLFVPRIKAILTLSFLISDLKKWLHGDKRMSKLTVVCAEFDHWDEAKHNAELNYGGANVLALILAMTKDEDEIRMICAALEMIFRASESHVHAAFVKVGASVVPWLLQVLEICEQKLMKHPEISIMNITKTLAYFSRISELRSGLARQDGMMEALARVSTAQLPPDCRTCRMRLIANLANCDDNKGLFLRTPGVLESVLRIAALDPTEAAREYSSITLMDLAACKDNQVAMAVNDKLLGTLVKLIVTEVIPETREAAVTAIQNLAYCQENRVRLVTFSSGVVLEALKKNLSSDKNDKSRRRAAGAITNLASEDTAELLGNYKGLLQTLAIVSSKDTNKEVQERAIMALTKVAACITFDMACYRVLLDALVVASLSSHPNSISAVLRVKARVAENRQSMARHPGILDTLADISLSEQFPINDRENAMRAIMHLTNEDENCKIMCHKTILDALVTGVAMEGKGRDIAESAIVSLQRLATDVSNREKMARHDGLLTAVAKVTEREAKLERETKATPTKEEHVSRKLLAKPLLMSLLVAMP